MNKKISDMNLSHRLSNVHCVAVVTLALAAWFLGTITSHADNVVADDQIVQGSLAVGLDATVNQDFGFDVVRYQESNVRVFYDDTSTSPFPANDWRLVINDSNSGGQSYYRIDDVTAGTSPFTIQAGATNNCIFVRSNGLVGIKTANPVVDLHVFSSDTPRLRLDQVGGYGSQQWDIAGNETSLFIEGNGKLPVRIQPSTPNNTLTLGNNGNVGIRLSDSTGGVPTAKAALHIGTDTDSTRGILIGPAGTVSNAANLHVVGTALITSTLEVGSSRATKENITPLGLDEARQTLRDLAPVKFKYKNDSQRQLGFISEDVPDLVATERRTSLVPMDFVAVLTKVVQDQEQLIGEQRARLDELAAELKQLKSRLPAEPSPVAH